MTLFDVEQVEGRRHVTAQASGAGLKLGGKFAELAEGPVRPGAVLGRKGTMSVRIAATRAEIEASQRLRYEVFYRERSALADDAMASTGRDQDTFDDICDHMLVVDSAGGIDQPGLTLDDGTVVGTYRLLRQEVAEAGHGFYSASEYDIAPLIEAKRGQARSSNSAGPASSSPIAPSPLSSSCGRASGTMCACTASTSCSAAAASKVSIPIPSPCR